MLLPLMQAAVDEIQDLRRRYQTVRIQDTSKQFNTDLLEIIELGNLLDLSLLTAASAGVFLHAGIKFPWFVFFQKDSGLRPKDAPWNMAAAMVLFSFLCLLLGVAPELLYRFLPYPVEYQAYTAGKVVFYL